MIAHFALLLAVQVAHAGVAGTVRDDLTGQPLGGVWVSLADLDRRALTDADGRFSFVDLPPGPQHISIERHGFAGRTLHALVPRSGMVEVNVALEPEPLRLPGFVVQPLLPLRGVEDLAGPIGQPDPVSQAAVRNHPLLAEPDVFRVLEGGEVAVLPESHAGLHIRGGAASHTAYELDGLPVLGPLHAAGLFSAWNPDALSNVRLSSGSGGVLPSLSGTVAGETRSPTGVVRGAVALSTTQARVTVDGPITSGGAGYVISLRRGFPHSAWSPRDPAKIRGEVGDMLAKVELPFLRGALDVLAYSSENDLTSAAIADAVAGGSPLPRNGFEWQTQTLGATWRRPLAAAALEVRLWDARGTGGASILLEGVGTHQVENERSERGAAATVSAPMRWGKLRTGLQVSRGSTSYSGVARGPFATLGSLTVGSVTLGYESPPWSGLSALAEVDVHTSAVGSYASPKVTASARIGQFVTITGAMSRRHQFAQSLRNEESLLGTVFPADLFVSAGSPGVPVAWADETNLKVALEPIRGLLLGAQVYTRDLESVLYVASRTGSLFSGGGFDVGSADVTGVAFDATLSGSRYGVVADYAHQNVRNRLAGGSFIPSYAPEHRAQLGVVFHPTPTASLRLSQTGIWGRTTTALLGGIEWESCNLVDGGCELAGAPIHGARLGEVRPGPYLRTDLGIRKHWHLDWRGRDSMLTVYGTITNLLGRANILNYSIDPLTGGLSPIDMLPFSPLVVGLELEF